MGDIDTEMLLWYRPEEQGLPRPAFAVDLTTGGSDLGGSVAAALAASSIAFRNQNDTQYAGQLLAKAQEVGGHPRGSGCLGGGSNQGLPRGEASPCIQAPPNPPPSLPPSPPPSPPCPQVYEFAKAVKGRFGDGDFNLTVLYNTSTFYDDLAWAAGWLYKATKQASARTGGQGQPSRHRLEMAAPRAACCRCRSCRLATPTATVSVQRTPLLLRRTRTCLMCTTSTSSTWRTRPPSQTSSEQWRGVAVVVVAVVADGAVVTPTLCAACLCAAACPCLHSLPRPTRSPCLCRPQHDPCLASPCHPTPPLPRYAYDWDNVFWPLNLLLAQETERSTFRQQTELFLKNWICAGNAANYTQRGRAYNPMSGAAWEVVLVLVLVLVLHQAVCMGMENLAAPVGRRPVPPSHHLPPPPPPPACRLSGRHRQRGRHVADVC